MRVAHDGGSLCQSERTLAGRSPLRLLRHRRSEEASDGWLTDPESWIALLTLTVLEIVLGIDNIIFISILAGKLPEEQQAQGARRSGLALAMVIRILLLALDHLDHPPDRPALHACSARTISGRDLILLVGGLFLIAKATHEIHDKLEGEEGHAERRGGGLVHRASSSRSCCSTSSSRSTR